MLIGCVAIAGIPPLAGFFSKDAILFAQWQQGWYLLWGVGLFTSFLTAFYMFRMWFLTFMGTPRDPHAYEHAHEGPAVMNVPLLILAAGTCVVGFFGLPEAMGGSSIAAWLAPAVGAHAHLPAGLEGDALKAAAYGLHQTEYLLAAFAILGGLAGITLAFLRFGTGGVPVFGKAKGLFALFQNRYFADHINDAVFVRGSIDFLGWGFRHVVDRWIIDGPVRGLPTLYYKFSDTVRVMQTGAVRAYAYAMLLGMLAIMFVVMSGWSLLRF
jgi:NADH-quinone oxidoreductase subunit L